MASLLNNIIGNTDIKINDQIIANDGLMGLKGASAAYLGATLESTTPEVRRMYSEFLSQCVMSHEALTALAVKQEWYTPYMSPQEQLSAVYKQAEWALNANA